MDSAYQVREQLSGQVFRCQPGQSVLRAMEIEGKHCVPVGCRGGGCGLCKVLVLRGLYQCGRMSAYHVPAESAAQGLALACQVFPQSDLTIKCLHQDATGLPANKNE